MALITAFILDHMKPLVSIFLLLALAGCAYPHTSSGPNAMSAQGQLDQSLALFSASPAGQLPSGWEPLIITRSKRLTHYQLVTDQGQTVLQADAVASASALLHELNLDPQQQPWLEWRWKIKNHIKAANNRYRATEDSPVRILLAFDGDKDSLPFSEQIMFETGKIVSGHEMPYATLMYIWEQTAPVGSIIAHTRTGRLKMLVAASGHAGIGQWHQLSRNIVDDYQRAFGEKPGRLIGVGVMTDTDNTGATAQAWYGDIRLLQRRP